MSVTIGFWESNLVWIVFGDNYGKVPFWNEFNRHFGFKQHGVFIISKLQHVISFDSNSYKPTNMPWFDTTCKRLFSTELFISFCLYIRAVLLVNWPKFVQKKFHGDWKITVWKSTDVAAVLCRHVSAYRDIQHIHQKWSWPLDLRRLWVICTM